MALKVLGLDPAHFSNHILEACSFHSQYSSHSGLSDSRKSHFLSSLGTFVYSFPYHNFHLLFNFSDLTLSPFGFYLKCYFLRERIHKPTPEQVLCSVLLAFCVTLISIWSIYLFIWVLPPILPPDSKFYENNFLIFLLIIICPVAGSSVHLSWRKEGMNTLWILENKSWVLEPIPWRFFYCSAWYFSFLYLWYLFVFVNVRLVQCVYLALYGSWKTLYFGSKCEKHIQFEECFFINNLRDTVLWIDVYFYLKDEVSTTMTRREFEGYRQRCWELQGFRRPLALVRVDLNTQFFYFLDILGHFSVTTTMKADR